MPLVQQISLDLSGDISWLPVDSSSYPRDVASAFRPSEIVSSPILSSLPWFPTDSSSYPRDVASAFHPSEIVSSPILSALPWFFVNNTPSIQEFFQTNTVAAEEEPLIAPPIPLPWFPVYSITFLLAASQAGVAVSEPLVPPPVPPPVPPIPPPPPPPLIVLKNKRVRVKTSTFFLLPGIGGGGAINQACNFGQAIYFNYCLFEKSKPKKRRRKVATLINICNTNVFQQVTQNNYYEDISSSSSFPSIGSSSGPWENVRDDRFIEEDNSSFNACINKVYRRFEKRNIYENPSTNIVPVPYVYQYPLAQYPDSKPITVWKLLLGSAFIVAGVIIGKAIIQYIIDESKRKY